MKHAKPKDVIDLAIGIALGVIITLASIAILNATIGKF